jgi:hypothetical protein
MKHRSVTALAAPTAASSPRALVMVAARWVGAGLVTGAVIVGVLHAAQAGEHGHDATSVPGDVAAVARDTPR